MDKVSVKPLDAARFEVTVESHSTTTHIVTVQPDYAAKLSGGKLETSELLRQSFDFLLERETNTSILRSFDLSVISRYFPEYESTIRSHL